MFHASFADEAFLAGRLLFGGLLAFMALGHFTKFGAMKGYAAMKKVPAPGFAILGSGAALLLGALSIATGWRPEVGVLLVTLFFVPVTLRMHDFWNDTDPMARMGNLTNFLKNTVILGGAWMSLAVAQPWPYSLG